MEALSLFELAKTVPVLEVIAHYSGMELQRRGRSHKGHCPFHQDDTPSFVIFPNNRWKCFGCGTGGDGVDFLARWAGISPMDAARQICNDFGLLAGRQPRRELLANMKRRTREIERRRELKALADRAYNALALLYRTTNSTLQLYGWKGYNELAPLVHKLPVWEQLLDMLSSRDPAVLAEALKSGEVREWL